MHASELMTPAGPDTDEVRLAELARALAHPARIRIVRLLVEQGNCICGDLVAELNLAQSTVSEHLRILKAAGVIDGMIEHPRVCYSLVPGSLASLSELLALIATASPDGRSMCERQI